MEKAIKIFDLVLRIVCSTLIIAVVIIVLVNVIARYILSSSIYWSEELSIYLTIWLVFLAAGIALRQGKHVGLEYIIDKLPKKYLGYIKLIQFIFIALFLLILIYSGCRISILAGRFQKSPSMEISMFWVYLSIPLGASTMFVQLIITLFSRKKIRTVTNNAN